jgi:hypothetical protein
MDLTPTPEQKMLRDAAHKYLRAEYAFDARRQLLATDTGMSAAHWRRFAEFGWLGLGLPEAHGGFGGMPDVVQVAEALGAALVVEPCLASTVLAGQAIVAAGNPTQNAALLPPLVSGGKIYTLAHTEADAGADMAWVTSSARLQGGRWLLSGRKTGVPAAPWADAFVVAARTAGAAGERDGIGLFVVPAGAPGVRVDAYLRYDGARAGELQLDAVAVEHGGVGMTCIGHYFRAALFQHAFGGSDHHLQRFAAAPRRRAASTAPGARQAAAARQGTWPARRACSTRARPSSSSAMLAGEGLYDGVPPGASIITGIGLVSGRPCMLIIANDATVKGGTYYGMTCKKHVRAQQFAWQHRLPCITLVDSGGAFLPDMANIFPDDGQFGSIFNNQVRMSAEGIRRSRWCMGPCTAAAPTSRRCATRAVIVRNQGFMYLGGPRADLCRHRRDGRCRNAGRREMHSRVSGVTDHIAETTATRWPSRASIVRDLGEPPQAALDAQPPPSRRASTRARSTA